MSYAKDLTGRRYGRLKVISRNFEEQKKLYSSTGRSVAFWNCICDCGDTVVVRASNLNNSRNPTLSCGCFRDEAIHKQKNTKLNKWCFNGNVAIGYTSKNERFYIDKEDYEKVKNFCWRITPNNYVIANSRDGTNHIVWLHRIVMGVDDISAIVDHKNWDKLDNRKENLRIATKSENNTNIKLKSNNTSGYPGVTLNKRNGKYIARISKNKKRIYLGAFDSFIDAVKARRKAEIIYHDEWSGENNKHDYERLVKQYG